jgi:phosphoribosylformylglycinamidine synthase
LQRLHEKHHVTLQYATPDFQPTNEFPLNPNGAIDAIAGICDETGRLFGLMPHPEGYLHYTNHPRWTREKLPKEGMGLAIFRNAMEYIRKNLS